MRNENLQAVSYSILRSISFIILKEEVLCKLFIFSIFLLKKKISCLQILF